MILPAFLLIQRSQNNLKQKDKICLIKEDSLILRDNQAQIKHCKTPNQLSKSTMIICDQEVDQEILMTVLKDKLLVFLNPEIYRIIFPTLRHCYNQLYLVNRNRLRSIRTITSTYIHKIRIMQLKIQSLFSWNKKIKLPTRRTSNM